MKTRFILLAFIWMIPLHNFASDPIKLIDKNTFVPDSKYIVSNSFNPWHGDMLRKGPLSLNSYNHHLLKSKFLKDTTHEEKTEKGWGFRFGYQLSMMANKGTKSNDNLSTGYIGFVKTFKHSRFFRTETGLEYDLAGAHITDSTRLMLHYIVLPVQALFKLGPFIGLVGVNGNFLVGNNFQVHGHDVTLSGAQKPHWFDLPLDAGLGFKLAFVTIEARYYWGMFDVVQGYKNQYLQAGLKFTF
jgi:hypothetical protein